MTGMTVVRMLQHMTGGRYDGRQWPGYGALFDVPEWEAEELLTAHIAESPENPELNRGYDVLAIEDTDYEPKLKRLNGEEPQPEEEEEFEERDDINGFDFDSDFDRDDSDSEVSEPVPHNMKRPRTVDNKDAWIEWAVHNGANENSARAQTKAALIAEYGSL